MRAVASLGIKIQLKTADILIDYDVAIAVTTEVGFFY